LTQKANEQESLLYQKEKAMEMLKSETERFKTN